jgi:hypothetical protein
LKYWIYDHLDGSAVGSVVNFAAGISNTGYQESGFKVVSWGYPINHAMTFVGWDDAIEYDFNGDGLITNTIDINGDQIVDMRDWERGAMIMVNSWSTGWMNGGKAYVMYKLLADAAENGGIHANKVYGINVKETQESQLFLKLKMTHNVRNQIQIKAGVSGNVSSSVPEFVLNFPLFNHQGGEYNMRGSGNTTPIEISLDVTTLLNTVTSGTDAKYFLQIVEDDPYSLGTGMIYDFSIVDAAGNEYISSTHNVPVADNTITQLEVIASIPFDAPQITTVSIPSGGDGESYSYQLEAAGGTSPYIWSIQIDYDESTLSENYPDITATELTPSDYDDGYAVQAIDFDFPFYGELYNQFTVCTDGSLLFEEGFEYLRTNEAIMSTKMIGVFASDLMIFPASGDGIFYEGDANSATFRWKTSLFGDENANIDAALTLYPSGEMKFYYGSNITEGISWAAGISNGEGSYTISSISGNFSPSDLQYQMSSNSFPCGMTISGEGIFSGITPAVAGSWDINFKVLDNNNLASYKSLNFTTITTSVEDINDRFLQISPVPCTDVATITYQLESETPVWISVYDISGKLVAVLKNSVEPAGEYQINWSPMESKGIYFIDLKTNRYHLTKRIAVINN